LSRLNHQPGPTLFRAILRTYITFFLSEGVIQIVIRWGVESVLPVPCSQPLLNFFWRL